IDINSADARKVICETSPTMVDQGTTYFRVLKDSQEVVVSAERDNYQHLYLHDSLNGKLIRRLTKGPWVMRKILKIDVNKRVIYFLAAGIDKNIDPYYTQLCSVHMDLGPKSFKVLTPEAFEHEINLLPKMGAFIDTYSRADKPFVRCLRSLLDGKIIKELNRSDYSGLVKMGDLGVSPAIRPPCRHVFEGEQVPASVSK
ncbi:MAG: DPP IV N-terminal domain-containing protein, partial [Lentisphaeraceae bacterium]|nr:DPP IV N-terminal domain-containing protein [Lentisphaeraceae bacterium]